MALNAGTAYVDILPRAGVGFTGALQGMLSTPLGKAGLIAGGVAVAGVAAGVAGAVKSVNAFASLEQGMNEVFTLLPDISEPAMQQLTDDVRTFSKEMGVLPDDVVPALYQAISAGVPKENVFDFLETAQKAALGGVTDLTTSVDGITSVVNAYGEDVVNATEASDLMFTAVRLGKTNFEELSASLFQVIPTASALGVGFEDVTAGLAAMTAQGTPTKVATTQMRQLLVELSKAGGQASEAFTDIAGKPFADFIAEGGSVAGALELMQESADKNGVALQDMFGSVEAGAAALSLTGSDAFVDNLEEMGKSAGATDAAFETMDQGLSRTWERIKAVFAVALTDIGERLAPFVQKAADLFEKVLPKAIDFFMGVLGPAFDVIGGIFEFLTGLFSGAGTAGDEAFTGLGETVGGLSEIFATVGEIIGGVVEFIKLILDGLSAFWDQWGSTIMALVSNAFNTIVGVIQGALNVVKGIIDVVLGILTGDWSRVWEGIKSIFSGIWKAIVAILKGIVGQIIAVAKGFMGNFGSTISGGLENVIGFFKALPGRIFKFLYNLPAMFAQLGLDLVAGLLKGLGNIVGSVGDKIKSGISGAIGKVKGFFGIGSPSKVFADEIGGPLLQGILMPFEQGGDRTMASAIAGTVTSGARAGARAAAGALTSTGTTSRVAGPVGGLDPNATSTSGHGMVFEEGSIVITNPEPEPASVTLPRELRRISFQNSRG